MSGLEGCSSRSNVQAMITLYEQATSGNCYKVRLVLTHTGRPFRRVEVSARDGSTRTAEFLARNPIGKVPTVELDDGRPLGESNAHHAAFRRGHAAAAGRCL